MKTTHCFKHVFTILLMSFLCLASCSKKEDTKNQCENTNCVNGKLNETTCECMCDQGYEGADCATEERTKFIGSYTVEYCGYDTTTYACDIAAIKDNIIRVEFSNFAGEGALEKAYGIISRDSITIPNQLLFEGTLPIKGNGTLVNKTLTINYTLNNNVNCTDIYVKQ